MTHIKQILCPVDGSALSRRALDAAVALGRLYGARVSAVEVLDTTLPPLPADSPEQYVLTPAIRQAYWSELQSFVHGSETSDVAVDRRLIEGHVVQAILREANSLPADLIVIGTHGRGGFDRFVLGSVTEKLLHKAVCPVLTVPPCGPVAVDAATPFHSILCAVDFSAATPVAISAAADLAGRFNGTLTVVHVLDWVFGADHIEQTPPPVVELDRSLEEYAHVQLHEYLRGVNLQSPAKEVVVRGKPAPEILHMAQERKADLIVMGVTGRGSVDLALLGSTANHVVRASQCPVLTVRTSAHRRLVEGAVEWLASA